MSRKERRLAKHRAETHDLTKADSPPAPSPSPPSFDQGPWFQHGDIQQFGSPADVPELDADEVAGEVVPIASQGTSVNVPGTPEDDELASPPPLPPVAAASAQIRRAAQDDVPLQIRRALAPQQAALPAPASWQRMPREARHVDPTETSTKSPRLSYQDHQAAVRPLGHVLAAPQAPMLALPPPADVGVASEGPLRPHVPRHATYEMFAAGVGNEPEDTRVIEIVLDVYVSRGGENEVFITQEAQKPNSRAKIKRNTEVNLRLMSAADREVFTKAKAKEWQSYLSKEAVELVHTRTAIPRSQLMRVRWVLTWKADGTAKARLVVLCFQDPRLGTIATSSPTLSDDGEMVILQWLLNNQYLLQSGDLKTAFLSGDVDSERVGKDSIFMEPPADLKGYLFLGPNEALRLRKSVYGFIDAPRKWHLRLSRELRALGFVPLLMDECIWILPGALPSDARNSTAPAEKPEQIAARIKAAADGVSLEPDLQQFLDVNGRCRPRRHIHGVLGIHVERSHWRWRHCFRHDDRQAQGAT